MCLLDEDESNGEGNQRKQQRPLMTQKTGNRLPLHLVCQSSSKVRIVYCVNKYMDEIEILKKKMKKKIKKNNYNSRESL